MGALGATYPRRRLISTAFFVRALWPLILMGVSRTLLPNVLNPPLETQAECWGLSSPVSCRAGVRGVPRTGSGSTKTISGDKTYHGLPPYDLPWCVSQETVRAWAAAKNVRWSGDVGQFCDTSCSPFLPSLVLRKISNSEDQF